MIRISLLITIIFLTSACENQSDNTNVDRPTGPFLTVLGIAQDAGFPQAACTKACCTKAWADQNARRMVSCLGLVDPESNKSWLFDATPDFKDQLQILEKQAPLAGIFLTHAHIGHYTGLMHLGREVMGAKEVPVYAMPLMTEYLSNNGPWSQLVELQNIVFQDLENEKISPLNSRLQITPLRVPHRDEFSETVGFHIQGPRKSALFIPDIDKWELWDKDIINVIETVDFAFLDGTFFQNGEIPGRDMSQIPHPFIEESMQLFKQLSDEDKTKVYFIHFNHTNPVLQTDSEAKYQIERAGYHIAEEGAIFEL